MMPTNLTVSNLSDAALVLGTPRTDAQMIVTFSIGPQQYGLPLAVVTQVVRMPALLTLAGAPPFLCGLLNLRGQFIPVLDGRMLIGEPATYELTSQIVIIGDPQRQAEMTLRCGLLVDQVHDVRTVHANEYTALERGAMASFLNGILHSRDYSALLFDTAELLALLPAQHAA